MMSTTQTEDEAIATTRDPLPRVLVVEREKEVRDIVVPWLFRDGFDCREAAGGQAAVDLLATGIRIDLVLSNLILDAVDGITLLQYVKKNHACIPFAFLSTVHIDSVREEA